MIMNNAKFAIGVDIGGTHVTAALIDLHNKAIISSSVKRTSVNAAGTADEIIKTWSACIRDARQDCQVEGICFAMPGPVDYEAGISLMRGQAKYENLYGLNMKEELAKSLGCPVHAIYMDNDAACFLQGEVFNGAANAYSGSTVIGITLGTGLGSAVYKGGASQNADMWRWPFKEGIAEDYLCTRWFVQRWKQVAGETIEGVKEIGQLPETSENAKRVFIEFGEHLADFLLEFIAEQSAEAVVIGGNIAKAFEWFGPTLESVIGAKHPTIRIEQAILGESGSLLGAVSSWLKRKSSISLT
jgi:glucokinase